MAPEFLPIVMFVVIAAIAIISFIGGVVLVLCQVSKIPLPPILRLPPVVVLSGAVLLAVILLGLGVTMRQQYSLNEPLVSACARGDIAEVQRLLSRGASPDAYGVDCVETALIAASRAGHRDIVVLLLDHGAKIELEDIEGRTALQRAREAGRKGIVKVLEERVDAGRKDREETEKVTGTKSDETGEDGVRSPSRDAASLDSHSLCYA